MNGSQRQTHKETLQAFPGPAQEKSSKETLTKDAMDEMDILEASAATEEIGHGRFGNRGSFKPRRPFGKFDKSPNTKCSRVSGRPINKDKSRCFKCKEFGHFQDECPTNKSSQDEGSGPKKFEDYTYTYSGPDIQPQMQINSVNPNFASTYDQALGVVKDSLNTANPLASLNL